MIPDSIVRVKLEGPVWNVVVEKNNGTLYIDVRDQTERTTLASLDLSSMEIRSKKFDLALWCNLVEASENELYFVEYEDQSDPAKQKYFKLNWDEGKREDVIEIPIQEKLLTYPSIYEHGGEYHKTVAGFLAVDLPLSCEYLEWDDKIIISYYLRFGNGFERYILLLQEGKKVWKVKQDEQMKGFSFGSFFVFQNQLIFIKDRNEVCVFTR